MPKGRVIKKSYGGPIQRFEESRDDIIKKWSGPIGANQTYPIECSVITNEEISVLKEYCVGTVCEIGCGTGRITEHFDPGKYIGMDINLEAIRIAREKNPKHYFKHIEWNDPYPIVNTYLFYTVLLHIPDTELAKIAARVKNRVIIVESFGRWKRDYGRDNNYQRDPSDFREAFKMKEIAFVRCYDIRYPCEIDFQIFE